MKIAIVGAGFCGLAACWHLLQNPHNKVWLFDTKGIGSGASGVPNGLLHYYAGPKASLSWQAHTAYPETLILLELASYHLGKKVYSTKGILRPEIAGMNFSQAINRPDTEWWQPQECQKHVPELLALPGLFIRSGIVVDCPSYLQGLWLACQKLGATLCIEKIAWVEELADYDRVLFTVGAGQPSIQGLHAPQVSLIKGQSLQLEWQKPTPLAFALNGSVQFSQTAEGKIFAGATFERKWLVDGPDASCEKELREKIAKMAPAFAKLALRGIWSGYRAATSDKKPFLTQCSPKVWVIGGMGSKGLLYHAWMAKQFAATQS